MGNLTVPEDGLYWFILSHGGQVRMLLDGEAGRCEGHPPGASGAARPNTASKPATPTN